MLLLLDNLYGKYNKEALIKPSLMAVVLHGHRDYLLIYFFFAVGSDAVSVRSFT